MPSCAIENNLVVGLKARCVYEYENVFGFHDSSNYIILRIFCLEGIVLFLQLEFAIVEKCYFSMLLVKYTIISDVKGVKCYEV